MLLVSAAWQSSLLFPAAESCVRAARRPNILCVGATSCRVRTQASDPGTKVGCCFAGAHSNPLQSLLQLAQNGSQWFAMRHRKKLAKLGRPADQRKHLLRSLTTEVLRHGKIKTTLVSNMVPTSGCSCRQTALRDSRTLTQIIKGLILSFSRTL